MDRCGKHGAWRTTNDEGRRRKRAWGGEQGAEDGIVERLSESLLTGYSETGRGGETCQRPKDLAESVKEKERKILCSV